ncbi:MAG: glycosyltransferase family 4 protein [Bryobacteraceae bacterium]|nr:glycosyltransferase family 4 protein [Bryobacteraceae bacterium]
MVVSSLADPLRRVVIDLTPVTRGGENGGAKVLALELIRQFSALLPGTEFLLLTSRIAHDELASLETSNVRRLCVVENGDGTQPVGALIQLKRLAAAVIPEPMLLQLQRVQQVVAERLPNGTLMRRLNADLLFCPFTAPLFYDPTVPAVSVVHDLQYLRYPQFFDPADRNYRDRVFRQACRLATHIICVSDYVRNAVIREGYVAPEKVSRIYSCVSQRLVSHFTQPENELLDRLGIEGGRYLLYPANFWSHKNHALLLTAFGVFRRRHPDCDLKLVLSGTVDDRARALQTWSRVTGLSQSVIFAGYLPEKEFGGLLKAARGLIFPSLYEGFGIPILEAMTAGVPVLASDLSAFEELGGDAILRFDPRKAESIVKAIERLEFESSLADQLRLRGLRRAATFATPSEVAASYLQVFRRACAAKRDWTRRLRESRPEEANSVSRALS